MAVAQRHSSVDVLSKWLGLEKTQRDVQLTPPRNRILRRMPKDVAASRNSVAMLRDETTAPTSEILALNYDDASSLCPPRVCADAANDVSLRSLARDDDGSELESPPSICHSPTWSDRGRRKSAKREASRSKSRKRSESKAERPSSSRGRGRRLTKQPPPAAMETQRMSIPLSSPAISGSSTSRASSRDSQWSSLSGRRSSMSSFTSILKMPTSLLSKSGLRSRGASVDRNSKPSTQSDYFVTKESKESKPTPDSTPRKAAPSPSRISASKPFQLTLKNFSFSSDKAFSKEFEREMLAHDKPKSTEVSKSRKEQPSSVRKKTSRSSTKERAFPLVSTGDDQRFPCTVQTQNYRGSDYKLQTSANGKHLSVDTPYKLGRMPFNSPCPTVSPSLSSGSQSPPPSPNSYVQTTRRRRNTMNISGYKDDAALSAAVEARLAEERIMADPRGAVDEIIIPPIDQRSFEGEIVEPVTLPQPLRVSKNKDSQDKAQDTQRVKNKPPPKVPRISTSPAVMQQSASIEARRPQHTTTFTESPQQEKELVVEGVDGDGMLRRTSVKRPKSTPDLNLLELASAAAAAADFLPPLKHQPLPRANRPPSAKLSGNSNSNSSSNSSSIQLNARPQQLQPPPFKEKSPARYSMSTENLSRISPHPALRSPLAGAQLESKTAPIVSTIAGTKANHTPKSKSMDHSPSLQRRSAVRGNRRPSLTSPPTSPASSPTEPSAPAKQKTLIHDHHQHQHQQQQHTLPKKPVAKMFVICCQCRYWHDLPSRVYEQMAFAAREEGGIGGSVGGSSSGEGPSERVGCPYCKHGMGIRCCEGWTTVVYLHERHH